MNRLAAELRAPANYTLNFNFPIKMRKNNSLSIYRLRQVVYALYPLVIIFWYLNEGYHYLLLGWSIVFFGLLFYDRKKDTPVPAELRFYDNYLLIYVPKRFYDPKLITAEIQRIEYDKITECIYYQESLDLEISGDIRYLSAEYNEYGRLSSAVEEELEKEDTIWYMIRFNEDVDFVAVLKKYLPIKVDIEDY